MDSSEFAHRLRRPEYTGENRCVPCTVVNAGIAVVVATGVAVVATPWFGVLSFAAAIAAIYFRGYLVPGTPTLTKRYFPPWLLRRFGKEPVVATGPTSGPSSRPLEAAGVLRATDAGPALTPRFATVWAERASACHTAGITEERIAAAFDAESVSRLGDTSFVLNGDTSRRWESTAALAADVAAAELLAERTDWDQFERDHRRTILQALRLCLEDCPACDAELTVETERVDPCCQKPHLVTESSCETCGAVVADVAVVDTGDVASVSGTLLEWDTRDTEIDV